jgi:hypothetical protein
MRRSIILPFNENVTTTKFSENMTAQYNHDAIDDEVRRKKDYQEWWY